MAKFMGHVKANPNLWFSPDDNGYQIEIILVERRSLTKGIDPLIIAAKPRDNNAILFQEQLKVVDRAIANIPKRPNLLCNFFDLALSIVDLCLVQVIITAVE